MLFKYGYNTEIQDSYANISKYESGLESLLDDIDICISNTDYLFGFESENNDLKIYIGMEATNNESWFKKVVNSIVSMFKAIGSWFKSAWNWIKKKFGFGGSNDVAKVAQKDVQVKTESLAKSVEKIEESKSVTPEEADTIVENTVAEVIAEDKSEVNIKAIVPEIVEEVKKELLKILTPINESVNSIKSETEKISGKVDNLSTKVSELNKLISQSDLKKIADEIRTSITTSASLQKETDLKPIIAEVKKEIDRVISTRKDVNLKSIVPEIVNSIKESMPEHKELDTKKLVANIVSEVTDAFSIIKDKLPKDNIDIESLTQSISKSITEPIVSKLSEDIIGSYNLTVDKVEKIIKENIKGSYDRSEEDAFIEVAEVVVKDEVKENSKKILEIAPKLIEEVVSKQLMIEYKPKLSKTVSDKIKKATNRTYKSNTIKKERSSSESLTIKRGPKKVEFTTYLFSNRSIDTYNSKFKKFFTEYTSIKNNINLDNTNGTIENITNGIKLMVYSIMYMGNLADVLFSGVTFNSDKIKSALSSKDSDSLSEVSQGIFELNRSLAHLVSTNATLDLVEMKFDVDLESVLPTRKLDKSRYERFLNDKSKILATSVEISKAVSEAANRCLSSIGELDKFISNINPDARATRGLPNKVSDEEFRKKFKIIRSSMSDVKNIGSNLYKLLSKSNIIKIRKTLKTHQTLS